jgi:hypothetical protein
MDWVQETIAFKNLLVHGFAGVFLMFFGVFLVHGFAGLSVALCSDLRFTRTLLAFQCESQAARRELQFGWKFNREWRLQCLQCRSADDWLCLVKL